MLDTLKKTFGFQYFRPNQESIIKSIINKQDVFAVMPTGGGKSLCYQLPAKMMKGVAIVISPLISLMKDQVDGAKANGISAAFMNSSLSPDEISDVYRKLKNDMLSLLYIAPERFVMPHFLERLKTIPISFFAIDEAHCISEWGHDFRPDYLGLSIITEMFPNLSISAFTATATEKVQNDIINKIGLRMPHIVRASFNRPGLFYEVKKKSHVELQIMEFLREHPHEPGIIYRTTRDSVMETTAFLVSEGQSALPYHAGLTAEQRKNNQEAFIKDEVSIIVATIAFGMGIDKSNIRFIIHADLPKNIESYYQETGRGGRDGELAHCLLFFSRGDIPKIRYFIDQIVDENERHIAMEKLNQMIGYAAHNVCRRRQILGFFGEQYPDDNCNTCDICTGDVEKIDITIDAQILMSAISRTNQRFGAWHVIDVVTGADTKRIRELQHNNIKTYGVGKDKDKKYWRSLVDELLAQEIIEEEGERYPVLKLTPKSHLVLFGREKVTALKREERRDKYRRVIDSEFELYDKILFEILRKIRKRFAEEEEVPPYIIFSDKTLHEMCRYYPTTLAEMRKITGVGDIKLERYGNDFVSEIKKYLNLHPEILVQKRKISPSLSIGDEKNTKNTKKGGTYAYTYELIKKGYSIEEIAKERNFAVSTIIGHIEYLIQNGWDIDIDRFVSPDKRSQIEALFFTFKDWTLTPVVEQCNGTVSYEEARLVRAYLRRNE